jgi:uncharacterized protein YggE
MNWKRLTASILLLTVMLVGITGCETLSPPTTSGTPAATESSGVLISQQSTGIWVTGEGSVTVVPDIALLSLGVEAQTDTVAVAQSQAATAMAAVEAELDRFGIDDKDIKTTQFSIFPVRRWSDEKQQEVLIGYRVVNTVTVKVREVDDAGGIIDAVTAAGGDFIRINSISFTVDDPNAYKDEAREKAMADAEAKASQLAKLGNVNLGSPTYINESGISVPVTRPIYAEGAIAMPAPMAPPTAISPGEAEIRLSVQVVYGIR